MYSNSGPLEAREPIKSKAPEGETFPGSLITVVSTASGAEEKMKKTQIIDSTSNTAVISNPPLSKGVESVHVQTHNPRALSIRVPESERPGSCYTSTSTTTSPQPPLCSSERNSTSEFPSFNINAERRSLTPLTNSNEGSSNSDLTTSSPDPDGYVTPSFPIVSYYYPLLTVPHVPYTGYTAITIPASLPQPPLPEKQRSRSPPLQNMSDSTGSVKSAGKPSILSAQFHVSFSSTTSDLPPTSSIKVTPSSGVEELENRLSSKFVQDSSKYWYKPGISRDQGENICMFYGACVNTMYIYIYSFARFCMHSLAVEPMIMALLALCSTQFNYYILLGIHNILVPLEISLIFLVFHYIRYLIANANFLFLRLDYLTVI